MTETIAWWQKEKAAPAVRSLIAPFSLHAYAAPLHHPPAPASFRSSLRGIGSMPIQFAWPRRRQHTHTRTQAHTYNAHNSTTTAQYYYEWMKSVTDSESDGQTRFFMGYSQSLYFCRSRNFIRAVKLDRG